MWPLVQLAAAGAGAAMADLEPNPSAGPGKYDALCTYVREKAEAAGVILIVLGGNKGHGHSVQLMLPAEVERSRMAKLQFHLGHADVLRSIADDIRTIAYRDAGLIEPPLPLLLEMQFKNKALEELATLARDWHRLAEEKRFEQPEPGEHAEVYNYCASMVDGVFGQLGLALASLGASAITPPTPPQTPPPAKQP